MNPLRFAAVFLALSVSTLTPALGVDRTTVSVAAPWEIKSLDPSVSGFAFQRMQVMETLVDADSNGMLRPGLASGWEVSADGLAWRFVLRDGVTFHNGSALRPDAAVAALVRAAEKPGVLGKAPIDRIFADGEAVVIALRAPFAALPSLLAHSTTVIPAPEAFDGEGKPVAAIGTGPFRVDTLSPPQRMVVVRFEDYWGEKPAIEGASYLAASRAETRALLAESGDADLVFTLDPAGYARLATVGSVETTAVPIPRVVTLKLNAGHPFLSAPEARRALSLAIDRGGIAAGITRFRNPPPRSFSRRRSARGMTKALRRSATIRTRRSGCSRSSAGPRVTTASSSATASGSRFSFAPSPTVPSCRSSRPPFRPSGGRSESISR